GRTLPPATARQEIEGEEGDDDDRRSDSHNGDGRGRNRHTQVISGLACAKRPPRLKRIGPATTRASSCGLVAYGYSADRPGRTRRNHTGTTPEAHLATYTTHTSQAVSHG